MESGVSRRDALLLACDFEMQAARLPLPTTVCCADGIPLMWPVRMHVCTRVACGATVFSGTQTTDSMRRAAYRLAPCKRHLAMQMRSWANLVSGDKEERGLPSEAGEAKGRGEKAEPSAAPGRCTAFAVHPPRTHVHTRAHMLPRSTLSSLSLHGHGRFVQVTAEGEVGAAMCAQNVDEAVEGWLHGRRHDPIQRWTLIRYALIGRTFHTQARLRACVHPLQRRSGHNRAARLMVQPVAPFCNVLHSVATCCTVLQRAARCCNVLHGVATCALSCSDAVIKLQSDDGSPTALVYTHPGAPGYCGMNRRARCGLALCVRAACNSSPRPPTGA